MSRHPDLIRNPKPDLSKPIMEFFEENAKKPGESDWLRIEVPGKQTRYLRKDLAARLLFQIGVHAVTQRSNVIVREQDLIV